MTGEGYFEKKTYTNANKLGDMTCVQQEFLPGLMLYCAPLQVATPRPNKMPVQNCLPPASINH